MRHMWQHVGLLPDQEISSKTPCCWATWKICSKTPWNNCPRLLSASVLTNWNWPKYYRPIGMYSILLLRPAPLTWSNISRDIIASVSRVSNTARQRMWRIWSKKFCPRLQSSLLAQCPFKYTTPLYTQGIYNIVSVHVDVDLTNPDVGWKKSQRNWPLKLLRWTTNN